MSYATTQKRDPDAWIAKPQPTPEMCRLIHGIDCRRCVEIWPTLDRLSGYERIHNADAWKRDLAAAQERVAKLERWIEKALQPHEFVGEDCDCRLCGEGWCFYLHIRPDEGQDDT